MKIINLLIGNAFHSLIIFIDGIEKIMKMISKINYCL